MRDNQNNIPQHGYSNGKETEQYIANHNMHHPQFNTNPNYMPMYSNYRDNLKHMQNNFMYQDEKQPHSSNNERPFNSFISNMNNYPMHNNPNHYPGLNQRNSQGYYVNSINNINNIKNVNNIYIPNLNDMMMQTSFNQNSESIFNRQYQNRNMPLMGYGESIQQYNNTRMQEIMRLREMQGINPKNYNEDKN